MQSNISHAGFDKDLLSILSEYFCWTMPWFTDKTLKIYRIACEIFNITRSPDIVRSARLNFSELSLAINASLAIWIACKFLQITLFVGVDVSAGTLVLRIEGSLGLVPIATRYAY